MFFVISVLVPSGRGSVPREKGRLSSCFVTIGRGMWK